MPNTPGTLNVSPIIAWDNPAGLRQTIEAAPVGIAQFDEMGRFLLVNKRLCETFGYSRQDLLGRTFQEITFAEDLDACATLLADLGAGVIPHYRREKRFVRGDGSSVWVCVTVSAVRAMSGLVLFYIGIAEDVTQEHDERERREALEARLRTALDASRTGTFVWNIETGMVWWDPNLYRLMGLEPKDELQEVFASMSRIHPDDTPALSEAVKRCAAEGGRFTEEFRVVWPDGSMHYLRCMGDTFVSPEGKPLRMTGAITDLTDLWLVRRELQVAREAGT